jgi:hypothetical protein
MNYDYIITDNKVFELEGYGRIRYDRCGTNIDVIIQNKHRPESFPDHFKRKLKFLKENHPELLI